MRRITGNWLRKHDPKEVVVFAWPSLEEILTRNGLSFSFQNCLLFDNSVWEYDGKLPYQRDDNELREDLRKSRERFIKGINRFGYDRLAMTHSLNGSPITEQLLVSTISLPYLDSNGKLGAKLCLLSGRYVYGKMLYVGICSTPEDYERNEKVIERTTDASNLIIEISIDNLTLEKELKTKYKEMRQRYSDPHSIF